MPHGSFQHPTIGRIGFEFEMPRGSDAYLVAFEPDHDDYPVRVDADDAPEEWHRLAVEQMYSAVCDARMEAWYADD